LKKTLIVLLLVAAAVAYGVKARLRNPPVIDLPMASVKRGDVIVKATETGSLEPVNIVEIKSEQAGEIKTLHVRVGDAVRTGQSLATLQQESIQARQVAEARAAIEQEQLNWDETQREKARMAGLFEKGFVARVELERAQKAEENAHIRYDLARRQLLLTLGGDMARFEASLSRNLADPDVEAFVLPSPLSGTVIEVMVSEGEIVSSGTSAVSGGTPLMRIADLSRMWVKTKINEVNIGQLRVEQRAEVRLDAIPDKVYAGTVMKIAPKGETLDKIVTYEIMIGLSDSDMRLMPSMTANVDIITDMARDVLYLPRAAVTRTEGKSTVTLRTPTGETRVQPIQTGIQNETVLVIQEGLSEGDSVLLPEPEKKKDGEDSR
jgi:RND family efflux transporter MFP subunit